MLELEHWEKSSERSVELAPFQLSFQVFTFWECFTNKIFLDFILCSRFLLDDQYKAPSHLVGCR
ncbi:9262_t:CDS:2 [Dentiscutata erythropus]|uniref:9262_t:CDS:1 n=1 Tax=Dentiscutata erythropus TaxID=1348616 RepID=A0A9N9CVU5_9GLOM|nr:9262_t:CDS:2 [Dentiscutata erythropus]